MVETLLEVRNLSKTFRYRTGLFHRQTVDAVKPLSFTLREKQTLAIIGGGFTGLSAALHLAEAGISTVVLEARHAGFGASGRNGGWLSSNIPSVINNLLKHPSITPAQIQLLQRQVINTIDVVDGVCQQEQID